MTKQTKRKMLVLAAGVIAYGTAVIASGRYHMSDDLRFLVFLLVYLLIGFEAFGRFRDNLLKKRVFDENLLMILATVGAFGVGRYVEASAAMFLFEIGVIFEAASVDRTKKMIADMIDIRPEYATRIVRGKEFKVEPSALKLFNRIVIKPGERVPADAMVLTGKTTLDTKALTGEVLPQTVVPGDMIYSGCINLTGVIEAKVLALYEDSTVSRIMEMVEEAQANRSESESFITAFSRFYSPAIALIALLMMVVPPLTFAPGADETWIYRGLVVMIAACPAGIVLSTPVAFLGGIASAAKQGILVKGGNYLEILAKTDTFIFDKTGTLTEGVFQVQEIKAIGMTEEELLKIAAHVESYSNHPIAQSLKAAYQGRYDKTKVKRVREDAGYGVSALYDGEWVHIGNRRMVDRYQIETDHVNCPGTVLYVIIKRRYAGYIVISDSIKEGAKDMLEALKEKYQAVLVMLTGDERNEAARVARELEMDYAYSDLMPGDKLELVEEFLGVEDDSEKVACIGDGINDAPIIARADVGIAMGALGSAAAIEAADIVLMDDELLRIVDAVKIAKETMRVVGQNISFAMMIKVIVLALAALGYISMWGAVSADLGVMLVSIVNAAWVVKYTA